MCEIHNQQPFFHNLSSVKQHLRLNYLLQKYRKVTNNDETAVPVSSGGLQQFIQRIENGGPHDIVDFTSSITSLPDSLLLEIFSYLDVDTLCSISGVCEKWDLVANDELLWRKKLARDSHNWLSQGWNSNLALFESRCSDLSSKEIYIRCCPNVSEHLKAYYYHPKGNQSVNLRSVLKYLFPKRRPKFVLTGVGIEGRGSSIVRKIIECRGEPFKIMNGFQGISGIGSGYSITMQNRHSFDLSTIYSASRNEREKVNAGVQQRQNRLFLRDEQSNTLILTHHGQPFFKQIDGLIYAIDVTEYNQQDIISAKEEIKAFSNFFKATRHQNGNVPSISIVVLGLVISKTDQRMLKGLSLVKILELNDVSGIAWRVMHAIVEDFEGVPEVVNWLIERYNEQ